MKPPPKRSEKVHLELLVGCLVRDVNGEKVGRLRCAYAEPDGDDCVVNEWGIGSAALLSRLGLSARRLIGLPLREPLRVPWNQLDLSDPSRPRLRCSREELRREW